MRSGGPLDATVPYEEPSGDSGDSQGTSGGGGSGKDAKTSSGGSDGQGTTAPWGADRSDATAQVAFHYAAWYAEYYSKYFAQAARLEADKQARKDLQQRRVALRRRAVMQRQWLESGAVGA